MEDNFSRANELRHLWSHNLYTNASTQPYRTKTNVFQITIIRCNFFASHSNLNPVTNLLKNQKYTTSCYRNEAENKQSKETKHKTNKTKKRSIKQTEERNEA